MMRKIVTIDANKCNGCGLCVTACHEDAIGLIDGKAQLLRDDYCDGLGDCLPSCPTGAISFEMRAALPFDKAAVEANMAQKKAAASGAACPGTQDRTLQAPAADATPTPSAAPQSALMQWPVQMKLVPAKAAYFDQAHLLIAADCTAFAHGDFHKTFMRDKITLIGCPKLDAVNYAEKLTAILRENDIKSLSIVRMEVPCCGGLENAAKRALLDSGKLIPWNITVVGTNGDILSN